MFTNKEIAEYYDTTRVHYKIWWNLGKTHSLHYGIYDSGTKRFSDALVNTNRVLMDIGNISAVDKVLDMGCGLGGAAFFLANEKNAEVTGISLSKKQIDAATEHALMSKNAGKLTFMVMDYTNTSFDDESFDVVWACESVCHAPDKALFVKECFRVLKKGGRLILSDFFLTDEMQTDKHEWVAKWGNSWGVSNFISVENFSENLSSQGFCSVEVFDYTQNIRKSAKRLYYISLLGAIPSEVYNLFHSNVSRFARTHYKCGYYQYKALKEKLWKYNILLCKK